MDLHFLNQKWIKILFFYFYNSILGEIGSNLFVSAEGEFDVIKVNAIFIFNLDSEDFNQFYVLINLRTDNSYNALWIVFFLSSRKYIIYFLCFVFFMNCNGIVLMKRDLIGLFSVMGIRWFQENGSLSISPEDLILY